MQQELKDLKSVLRSLVVSSPTQVDVRSLLRDYRDMMGQPVPIAKYGYRDPLAFLRERCHDCFMFHGAPSNPVLTLIVPDSLKHIDKFVQKQKISSTGKFKGKRRSIPEQAMKGRNLVADTFIPKAVEINKSTVDPTAPAFVPKTVAINGSSKSKPVESKNQESNVQKSIDINSTALSAKSNIRPLMSIRTFSNLNISDKQTNEEESATRNKENVQANVNRQTERLCSQEAVHNFLKKRIPMYNSNHHIESEMSIEDGDSGRQTLSSNSSTKAGLFEELKIEIRDLIADYPEGVWCTDLIGLYRERYKRELNFSVFGYTSIVRLVSVLEDAVRAERVERAEGGDDWLLRDARAPCTSHPQHPQHPQPPCLLRRRVAPAPPAVIDAVDADDALPGIDFDPDVFPADCLHFMESIPAASLHGLEAGAMIEVVVGEVYSPSHFWLLRLGEQYNIAMEDMMDEMNEYYSGPGRERRLARAAARVGHYCASLYDNDWHRALVVRVLDCDTVKVRHVDYGTVAAAEVSGLKPLRRCWARLPAQALRARAAGLRPSAAARRWPHTASAHFLHLVRDTRLVASVVALDAAQDTLEVFLVDTAAAVDVCVTAEMIRSGHADARDDSALRTSESYLFPRFHVLEAGDTPNFGEIDAYLRNGIRLEYVDEFRRHVPACLPPPSPSPPSPSPPSLPSPPSAPSPPSPPLPSSPPSPPTPAPHSPVRPCRSRPPPASPGEDDGAERSPRPPAPGTRPPLARSASSPADGQALPPRLDFVNRVPFWPPPLPAPPEIRYPPPPFPPQVVFPPMLPMPGFVSFPAPVPLLVPPPPPPPPPPPLPPGAVTLSMPECEIFKLLSRVDANAAHWYMVDAISRAMSPVPGPVPGSVPGAGPAVPVRHAGREDVCSAPPGFD